MTIALLLGFGVGLLVGWIARTFRVSKYEHAYGIVLLDTDQISDEDAERIRAKLSPVVIKYSGHNRARNGFDKTPAVTIK